MVHSRPSVQRLFQSPSLQPLQDWRSESPVSDKEVLAAYLLSSLFSELLVLVVSGASSSGASSATTGDTDAATWITPGHLPSYGDFQHRNISRRIFLLPPSPGVPITWCSDQLVFRSTGVPINWCSDQLVFRSTGVPIDQCSNQLAFGMPFEHIQISPSSTGFRT
jgi:hypothetical protein